MHWHDADRVLKTRDHIGYDSGKLRVLQGQRQGLSQGPALERELC